MVCQLLHTVTFLKPEAPVRIVSPSESEVEVCILSSERLVLSCEISNAKAEVCWFCDGIEVDENDNLKLEDDGIPGGQHMHYLGV